MRSFLQGLVEHGLNVADSLRAISPGAFPAPSLDPQRGKLDLGSVAFAACAHGAAGTATSGLRDWETNARDNARGLRNSVMFDFTVRAKSGFWVLQDAECGELGAYETSDEALAAAGDWLRLIETPGRC
jgi:hypothetical protein